MSEDIDPDTLAAALEQLDPGTRIGDRFLLSKRQLLGFATGTLGVGALAQFGISEAEAQAAGQVGTSSSPVDVEANLINGGGPVTDGDGTERNIWIIANGAPDPSGASAEDIIFEEES
jgi:hypothetical protein